MTVNSANLRVNRDFYFILKDALEVGVPEKTLKKIIRERGISFRNFKKLLKGENIPYTAYKERMKKRVKEAEKLDRGKVNKEYFYPKKLLKQIEKEYKNKKLETQEPEIEPVSLITTSLDITGPLINPAISIAPELFTVPSILTVSLIKDLSVSFLSVNILFLVDPNIL